MSTVLWSGAGERHIQTGHRRGERVECTLRMTVCFEQRDGRWRVYDVLMDGVSFVATYRSEFERIIRESEFRGFERDAFYGRVLREPSAVSAFVPA